MVKISKKTGVLMITLIILTINTTIVIAQPALPEAYVGRAYIGDSYAPSGTSIRAVTTRYTGGSVTYTTTVSGSSGDYSLNIPVGNADFPNGAALGASITWYVGSTAATACGTGTPPTGSCSDTVQSGMTNTWNLKISGFVSGNITGSAMTVCYILESIYDLLIYIVSGIAVLTIVIQGIMWVSSGDDVKQRRSAKDGIVHVIVGLIIIGVAISVVVLVLPGGSQCIKNW